MNFDLSNEHELLEQSVREWAGREVAPRIRDLDRQHHFDRGGDVAEGKPAHEPEHVPGAGRHGGERRRTPARAQAPERHRPRHRSVTRRDRGGAGATLAA